jgi:hypothetical protein
MFATIGVSENVFRNELSPSTAITIFVKISFKPLVADMRPFSLLEKMSLTILLTSK